MGIWFFLDDDMIILPKSAAKVLSGGATSGQPVGNQLQLAASWSPTGCQLVATAQKNRENIGVVDIKFFLEVTNHNISYSWVIQLYPIAVELTS